MNKQKVLDKLNKAKEANHKALELLNEAISAVTSTMTSSDLNNPTQASSRASTEVFSNKAPSEVVESYDFGDPEHWMLVTDETIGEVKEGDVVAFAVVNESDAANNFKSDVLYSVECNDVLEGTTSWSCPLALIGREDWHYVDHQEDGAVLYKKIR